MNSVSDKKYTGDDSNEQRIFIKDARIGWRNLLNDPMKELANGIAQYEYLESLGPRMGSQARRLLDNFIDMWDNRDEANPFYKEAVTREASRANGGIITRPSQSTTYGRFKLDWRTVTRPT